MRTYCFVNQLLHVGSAVNEFTTDVDLSRHHFSLSFFLSSGDLSKRIPVDNSLNESVDKSRTHANLHQQRRAERADSMRPKKTWNFLMLFKLTQSTASKNGNLCSCCLRINQSVHWLRLSANMFFLIC
ncbi:uncharacterized protein [Pocillopora verrucosa]|uniref:uncharacterized protein n=1 Tax=Pocillopora verrucosa TaxID=203993 RepID=UPI0033426E61